MADPKIFSYIERGIKIENVREGVPINVFVKKGIPLSFRIEQDTAYITKKIKIDHLNKDGELVRKEVTVNKNFTKLFNSMKKHMFSSDTIVYCFYHDGKLSIYDCMSNTNYFPFSDIERIAYDKMYHYGEDGFIPMKPILSGYKKTEEVIEFFEKFLKENTDVKASDLFIMPAFPEMSSTTYTFADEFNKAQFDIKEDELVLEEIIEELEAVPTSTNVNVSLKPDGNVEVTTVDNIKTAVTTFGKKEIEYTLSFILKYIEENQLFINEVERSILEYVAILWTTWSNRNKMPIVYSALFEEYKTIFFIAQKLRGAPYITLSKLFHTIWLKEETGIMTLMSEQQKNAFTVDFINRILKDEYVFYMQALHSAYSSTFGHNWILSDIK